MDRSEETRCRASRRGSVVLAAVFFLFFLFLVAAMGVDLARYFYVQQQNQNIADGATLAAAQAFNQVRSLPDIDRAKITDAAFRHIGEREGYDTDAYELSADFKQGDLQTDTVAAPSRGVGGPTAIRVGLNVKYYFEPYFLPRALFGDEFFSVQSQAVAEARPVFSRHNLYDPREPGGPKGPLQYGIFSDENIKLETMDCLIVNGHLHTNRDNIKIEDMQGPPDCDSADPDVSDPAHNVVIHGDLESGNDIILEKFDGEIDGEARHQGGWTHSNAPVPSEGNRRTSVPNIDFEVPPTPADAPGQYPEPVCYLTGNQTFTGTNQLNGASSPRGGGSADCRNGGTVYVQEQVAPPEDGNVEIDFNTMDGDYTFVADGQVKFQQSGSLSSEDMFVYSVDDNIKFEDVDDAVINATLYAPNGQIKWETSTTITINGGLVSQSMSKLETTNYLKVNQRDHADLLPSGLRQFSRPNEIPDYWQVHLID